MEQLKREYVTIIIAIILVIILIAALVGIAYLPKGDDYGINIKTNGPARAYVLEAGEVKEIGVNRE